jgi:von Willebrand factor type A domain
MLKNSINKFFNIIVGLLLLVGFFAQPVLAQTDVNIESFNSSLFPFIYANVSVKSDGNSAIDLTRDDFFVYENNIHQTDFFEVTPPESGGGVRLADIVFLIDCSGSMGGEIADVRNNVIDFANALATSSIDYRLGLVRFGYGSGNPYLFNNGNLTGDSTTFRGFVASLRASGGYEPGFMAIQQAITGFNFRPGAQKIFLIITDEDSDAGNKQTTINMLLANSITLHAAARCNSGNSQSHYCNSTSVRAATGGLLFGVSSSYNTILDTIVEQASSTYVVRYKSSNPIFDQTVRNVEIFATADGETDSDTVSYIPGAAPEIELTPDTELLKTTPPECGYNLTISAVITDTSTPYVSSARLYYRHTSILSQLFGIGIFQSVNMVNTFGDVWEADIPGNIVNSPGVEFYITANDGQTNSSLPKSDPSSNPISIAVLPNELPQISHIPPKTGIAGQDLPIVADISDTTHNLESVKLFYRKLGEIQYTEVDFPIGLEQYQLNAVIPASVVTSYGVEYYIEAMDNLGAKSTKGTRDKPITIGVGFVWQRIEVDREVYTVVVRARKADNLNVALNLQETFEMVDSQWF